MTLHIKYSVFKKRLLSLNPSEYKYNKENNLHLRIMLNLSLTSIKFMFAKNKWLVDAN
jgi:hypothetical protein